MLYALLSNLSLSLINLQRYGAALRVCDECLHECGEALQKDPKRRMKIVYRKALALDGSSEAAQDEDGEEDSDTENGERARNSGGHASISSILSTAARSSGSSGHA